MGIPANHLIFNKEITRSGRIDSLWRLMQVIEDGPRAIVRLNLEKFKRDIFFYFLLTDRP